LLVDGCDLRLQCRQQNLRLLPLGGIGSAQGQSRELLLPSHGEQPEAQLQLVIEGHGLQPVLHHGAHAHQPVAIAQQRQGVLAGRSGPVHDGKLLATQQVQQQLGVAPVVLLPAPGELSNGVGIAHQQPVPRLLDQLVEPQGIPRGLDADHCGSGELRVERAHVVAAVVERVLVDLSVGCIHPADGLGADMQVNSDVHCHSRLLFKPKPNGSGREYQLSPRRRVSHDITYDELRRLLTAQRGPDTNIQRKYSYDYDRFGNRWAQTLVAGSGFGGTNSFDYAGNRVTTTNFTYDNSGNLTANGPGTSFTFNAENFMTAAGASATYSVDTKGRRTKKTVSGTTTNYFYSGSVLISEKQGSAWTDYIFFGNQRMAQQTGSTLTAAKFLHQDHLGSTRVCSDGSGNSAGTCDYEPFGEFQLGSACSSLPTNYRFAGMYYDSESGLYYTWFRQYDANQGRWMGVDPLPGSPSDPQSLNRYDYARNDPANLVDPSGLDPGCGEGCHALYLKLADNRRGPYLGCSCPGHAIQDVPGICTIVMKNGIVISNSCRGGEEIPRPDRPGGDPSSVLRDIKSAVCKAIPEGGTTGLSGGIGALGGQTGSIELVR